MNVRAWVACRRLAQRLRGLLPCALGALLRRVPPLHPRAHQKPWPAETVTTRSGALEIAVVETDAPSARELAEQVPGLHPGQLDVMLARWTAHHRQTPAFPIATYRRSVAGWRVPPSTQWIHRVQANPGPSERFCNARFNPESATHELPSRAEPEELLVHGRFPAER
ncbi:MAG: hypothetical protein AAF560_10165 [Acidobacteriota bacterium]